jgi:hypothetical protein
LVELNYNSWIEKRSDKNAEYFGFPRYLLIDEEVSDHPK